MKIKHFVLFVIALSTFNSYGQQVEKSFCGANESEIAPDENCTKVEGKECEWKAEETQPFTGANFGRANLGNTSNSDRSGFFGRTGDQNNNSNGFVVNRNQTYRTSYFNFTRNGEVCCSYSCKQEEVSEERVVLEEKNDDIDSEKPKCLEQRLANIKEHLKISDEKNEFFTRIVNKAKASHDEDWGKANKNCGSLIQADNSALDEYDFESESNPKSFDANTCVWVEAFPRQIIQAEECSNKTKAQICKGYVICKSKKSDEEPSFIRQSTCSAANCVEGRAVLCTKEGGYSSKRPDDEEKDFIKKDVKEKARAIQKL